LLHERLVCKTHNDIAGKRGDRGISPVDFAVRPDGLDAVEIVGIGKVGGDNIIDIHAIARDRTVEMPKTLECDVGWRAGRAARRDGLTLRHDACSCGQQA
jgi:hypothetical protein